PFSPEAIGLVDQVEQRLNALGSNASSPWHGTRFALVGTSVGIRDLKAVTESDRGLIQRLVVLAVLAVLILIIRRPLLCLYLIASVLFSYYVTIGATQIFFAWQY